MRHGIYRSSVEAEVRAPRPRGVRAPRAPACGGGLPKAGPGGLVHGSRGPGAAGGPQAPRPEKPPKQSLFPGLCPSCARADPRLPPPRACVYSSPSRRTPADAAARTPRTGYCGRRRRSDRPFRTGFSRWLGRKRRLSPKPPSFKSSLNPFYFNFKVLIWTESSILAQDERWRRA